MNFSHAVQRFLFAAAAIAVTLGVQPVFAQTTESGATARMIVTVEPRHANQTPTISRQDVLVRSGKDRLAVTGWTPLRADTNGVQLWLAIDDSLSNTLDNRLTDIQQFVNQLPQGVQVGVAYMRNGTVQIVQNATADHATAAKSIRLPQAIGTGSPFESIVDLIKRLPASAARRDIIMISDGIEPFGPATTDNPYVTEAITAAQRASIPVFTIYSPAAGHWGHNYWRTTWGLNYLSQLADETGGEGYGTSGFNPVSFTSYFGDIVQRLQNQYELTFLAKPPQNKDGMLPVRVMTEVPNVDLLAADRAYVPSGQ